MHFIMGKLLQHLSFPNALIFFINLRTLWEYNGAQLPMGKIEINDLISIVRIDHDKIFRKIFYIFSFNIHFYTNINI